METQEIKKEILQATKNIQKKYLNLKRNRIDCETSLQQLYKPLITSLTLPLHSNEKKNKIEDVKPENQLIKDEKQEDGENSTLEENNMEDESLDAVNFDGNLASLITPGNTQYLSDDILKSLYKLLKGDVNSYGLRYDKKKHAWYIGDKRVIFNDENIIVGHQAYTLSMGLVNLLVNKKPSHTYSGEDVEMYKQILKDTNALSSRYKNTRSYKNIYFITKLMMKKDGGDYFKSLNKPNIVYWNKLDEIIDRLRLLYASKSLGNELVNNEIIAILEELEEEGVIEKNPLGDQPPL